MGERWQRFCYWGEKSYRVSGITVSGIVLAFYLVVMDASALNLLTIPVIVGGVVAWLTAYIFDSRLDEVPVLGDPELWVRRYSPPISRIGPAMGVVLVIEVASFVFGNLLAVVSMWLIWSVLIMLRAYLLELQRREQLRPKSPDEKEALRKQFEVEFYTWLDELPETSGPDNDPR